YASCFHHRDTRWAWQHAGRTHRRSARGRVGGAVRLPHRTLAKERLQLRTSDPSAAGPPARHHGSARMRPHATSLSLRSRLVLVLFVLALLAAPAVVSSYLMSLLIAALFAAFLGQAWNFMMGFAGQLSLGHSLYIGLGGYASAALFTKFGISPW